MLWERMSRTESVRGELDWIETRSMEHSNSSTQYFDVEKRGSNEVSGTPSAQRRRPSLR